MADRRRREGQGPLGSQSVRPLEVRAPLGPGRYHIDPPAAAPRTDQPFAPIENRSLDAAPSSHLGGIGLDLMAASSSPDDQLDTPYAAALGVIGVNVLWRISVSFVPLKICSEIIGGFIKNIEAV